jgi:tRNA A37 threonylcarbamoyltransferase TsaD
MVDTALREADVRDTKKLEAIAVAVGPGAHNSLRVGIDLAQAIGAKYDIPVIPVNHIEAHIMTTRMEAAQLLPELPSTLGFPFLSVIATGKHTEIVLTRGIGLHTVLGFTLDIAVGTVLDRAGKEVAEYCKHKFGLNFDGGSSTD